MGTCFSVLRLLSLVALLGLTGCQAYGDAARALTRATFPETMRNAEAQREKSCNPLASKECVCEKSAPSR